MKDKKEKKKGIFAFSKKKEEKQKFSEPILISEHTHLDQMQKQANAAQQQAAQHVHKNPEIEEDEEVDENDYIIAHAVYDYDPAEEDEIGLRVGDQVLIYHKHESMWWTGECRGKYGIFPGAYVKEDDNQKGKILPSEKQKFLEQKSNQESSEVDPIEQTEEYKTPTPQQHEEETLKETQETVKIFEQTEQNISAHREEAVSQKHTKEEESTSKTHINVESTQLKHRYEELQSEYDELKKNYETLINELGSMHQQLKTSKTQNEELENKLKQEIKKNGDLTNQLQSSNREETLSFEIESLNKQLADKENQIQSLKSEISSKDAKHHIEIKSVHDKSGAKIIELTREIEIYKEKENEWIKQQEEWKNLEQQLRDEILKYQQGASSKNQIQPNSEEPKKNEEDLEAKKKAEEIERKQKVEEEKKKKLQEEAEKKREMEEKRKKEEERKRKQQEEAEKKKREQTETTSQVQQPPSEEREEIQEPEETPKSNPTQIPPKRPLPLPKVSSLVPIATPPSRPIPQKPIGSYMRSNSATLPSNSNPITNQNPSPNNPNPMLSQFPKPSEVVSPQSVPAVPTAAKPRIIPPNQTSQQQLATEFKAIQNRARPNVRPRTKPLLKSEELESTELASVPTKDPKHTFTVTLKPVEEKK